MWKVKQFRAKNGIMADARRRFNEWVDKNGDRCQWHEVYIANGYAVEYRLLRRM